MVRRLWQDKAAVDQGEYEGQGVMVTGVGGGAGGCGCSCGGLRGPDGMREAGEGGEAGAQIG